MNRVQMKGMVAAVRGAHAPSSGGCRSDDALVIANFFKGSFAWEKVRFLSRNKVHGGEGAAISTRGACAPQKADCAVLTFNVTVH